MRIFSARLRPGAAVMSPALLLALVVAPALAAGAYFVGHEDGVSSRPMSEPMSRSEDSLPSARKSLAATTLPLGLITASLGSLSTGSAELDSGARQISDAVHTARSGSSALADGMTQLRQGVWALGDGSTRVSGGVSDVVDSLTGLGAMQGQVELIVQQVIDQLATSADPIAASAIDQLTTVKTTLATQGLGTDVMARLQDLKSGAANLAFQLSDPGSEFVDGMARATTGSASLRDGLVTLDDGATKLVAGTSSLVDGIKPMSGVLASLQTNVTAAAHNLPAAQESPAAAESAAGSSGWAVTGVVLTIWALACVAAGRAVAAAVGRSAARAVLVSAIAAQVVISALAGLGTWPPLLTLDSFLPLGQLIAALRDVADGGPGVPTVVSSLVAVGITVAAVAVRAALQRAALQRAAAEPGHTGSGRIPDTELADSVP